MASLQQRPELEQVFKQYVYLDPGQNLLLRTIEANPTRKDIDSLVWENLIRQPGLSGIVYISNNEGYSSMLPLNLRLLKQLGNLGVPLITWCTSDVPGDQFRSMLHLASTIHQQVQAMLCILTHYSLNEFAIVTSGILGHDMFAKTVQGILRKSRSNFVILNTIIVSQHLKNEQELQRLVNAQARNVLVYCTKEEMVWIMKVASKLGLTGKNYIWIVTQSGIGDRLTNIQDLPVGMLGVYFDTRIDAIQADIKNALEMWVNGVDMIRKHGEISYRPKLTCDLDSERDDDRYRRIEFGKRFYEILKNVKVVFPKRSRLSLQLNPDGSSNNVVLQIMNLRPNVAKNSFN